MGISWGDPRDDYYGPEVPSAGPTPTYLEGYESHLVWDEEVGEHRRVWLPKKEPLWHVILGWAFVIVALAVILIVLAKFTVEAGNEPSICADITGGQCIP